MEKVVSTPRLKSDPIARQIIDYLSANAGILGLGEAILYYDFPLFRDYEDSLYQPTLLLLDANKGVVSIRVAGTQFEIKNEDEKLSELHSILFAKLLTSRKLRKTRSELKVSINSVLYLPPGSDPATVTSENIVASSIEGLSNAFDGINSQSMDIEIIREVRSVIEGVKALTKTSAREIPPDGSKPKAAILKKLEEEISNFDANQRMAALTVPIGPQRIRGLAGSGKTIVLAWKAAHLHMQDPDKKILFTFYTRSLYDIIRKQITRFYRHFKESDPNWNNLHVLHAWGGRRTHGVYYDTCIEHEVTPKQWADVMSAKDPFNLVCEDLMKRAEIRYKYDMILVDEAQDFPDSFFHLLFKLTNGDRDSKRIIWAYDELQSIFEPKMRTANELFGVDENGEPQIDLDRAKAFHGLAGYIENDLILKKCYRNPLDVLVCSHALGLGIYGSEVVQMLQNKEHWEDLGYEIESGDFIIGSPTVIFRPDKNSPLAINNYEQCSEVVQWFAADSFPEELDWIANEVKKLIRDGLAPEEILVICLDDRNVKTYFSSLANRFVQAGLQSNDLLSNPFSTPQFIVNGYITLSTVHRAKGNEASAVLVCGADSVALTLNRRRSRNKIFTAFTRTKGWLRVSGMATAKPIFDELELAMQHSPKLIFNWPDLEKVETLQRDLSKKQQRMIKLREEYMNKLAHEGITEEEAIQEFSIEEKSE